MQDDFALAESAQRVIDDGFFHAGICNDGLAADPIIHMVSHRN